MLDRVKRPIFVIIILSALVSILALIAYGWYAFRVHSEQVAFYALARDIARYSKGKDRLPPSVNDFCAWGISNKASWNVSFVTNRVDFAWLQKGHDLKDGQLLKARTPVLQKIQREVNNYFNGIMPWNPSLENKNEGSSSLNRWNAELKKQRAK